MGTIHFKLLLLTCCALLFLSACGNSASSVSNQAAQANANARSGTTPAGKAPGGSGGDPVDTSRTDAKIAQLEKEIENSPNDERTRRALAEAYLERAKALTDVRQYRAALGDYRRTLRYDPNNADAKQMSATIINILQGLGREVPAEGAEPTPLPMPSKETKKAS